MDIDVEIQLKKELEVVKDQVRQLRVDAMKLNHRAEEILSDAIADAYNKGAGVSFISSATGTNRQQVYVLLAGKGIRPRKGVVSG